MKSVQLAVFYPSPVQDAQGSQFFNLEYNFKTNQN